jgi:hypothetical protein
MGLFIRTSSSPYCCSSDSQLFSTIQPRGCNLWSINSAATALFGTALALVCLFFHLSGLKKKEQSKFTLRPQSRRQHRRWPIPTPHKSNHPRNRRRARAGRGTACSRQQLLAADAVASRRQLVLLCIGVHGPRSREALLASRLSHVVTL